jgi:hypothetical protein
MPVLRRVANGFAGFGVFAAVALRDLAGLGGIGAIAYGAWLIAPSYGFIAGGMLVLAGAILSSRKA